MSIKWELSLLGWLGFFGLILFSQILNSLVFSLIYSKI